MTNPEGGEMTGGFKRVGHHCQGCRAVARDDGEPFVITDRKKPRDHSLNKNGVGRGSTMWWRFVCNDLDCPAFLLVRWDKLGQFINSSLDAKGDLP